MWGPVREEKVGVWGPVREKEKVGVQGPMREEEKVGVRGPGREEEKVGARRGDQNIFTVRPPLGSGFRGGFVNSFQTPELGGHPVCVVATL